MNRAPRRTEVFLRIETDAAASFTFLQLNGYPHFWSPRQLSDSCVVRVMDAAGETLGYVWGFISRPGVMDFHGCAASGHRLPFFSSDLLAQLGKLAFAVGADTLTTRIEGSPSNPLRRLLLRLGFSETPDAEGGSTFSRNLWTPNGTEQQQ